MTKLVLPPLAHHAVYHTDPECVNLNNSDREPVEPPQRTIAWHGFGECPVCSGEKSSGEETAERRSPLTHEGYDPGPPDPDAIVAAREEAREIADSFERDPFDA